MPKAASGFFPGRPSFDTDGRDRVPPLATLLRIQIRAGVHGGGLGFGIARDEMSLDLTLKRTRPHRRALRFRRGQCCGEGHGGHLRDS